MCDERWGRLVGEGGRKGTRPFVMDLADQGGLDVSLKLWVQSSQ